MLGCEPERIVFTGGATESNNALFARLGGNVSKDKRVLSSAIEHPSVREPLQRWFPNRVTSVRTTASGEMDLEDLTGAIGRFAVVVITTDHSEFDYDKIAREARLVLDCRNAVQRSANVVPL